MSKLQGKFSVDEALDCVDLTFRDYVPSEEALQFFNLMRVFTGEDFEINSPKLHYFIVDMLFGNVQKNQFPYSQEIKDKIRINPSRVAVLCSRGVAKSTVVTTFYPIYCGLMGATPVTGPLSHMLILSDSQQGGARDQARLLGNMMQKSKLANEWFESIRCTDSEVELVRKGNTPVEQRHMLIKFKGAQSGGIRSGSRNPVTGDRYGIIIGDDVIKNEAEAYSEAIMHNVVTAVTSDALNAMRAKKTQLVLINTPFHSRDPIYTSIESGIFTPLVAPICKEIREDLTEEEFVGVWPQMHDYNSVMERYLNAVGSKSTRAFNQELMLRVSSDEDRMISDDLIQWYDRNLVLKMLDGYSLYITTDFTTTSTAKSDFSAIALWAVSSNNDYFLLDVCLRRQELQEQYNEVFRMINTWSKGYRVIDVGVEIDGQQKAHIFSLKELMQKKNMYFTFARQKGAPVTREGIMSKNGGVSKLERFRYALPLFQNKKVYFPEQLRDTPDVKEALKQLRGITYTGFSTHDDFPDVVSQLTLIDILPGTGWSGDIEEAKPVDVRGVWGDISDDDGREYGDSNLIF